MIVGLRCAGLRANLNMEITVRKFVAALLFSLDGVVVSPETSAGSHHNEEIGQTIASLIDAGDILLLGRVTCEGFVAALANQTEGMVVHMMHLAYQPAGG